MDGVPEGRFGREVVDCRLRLRHQRLALETLQPRVRYLHRDMRDVKPSVIQMSNSETMSLETAIRGAQKVSEWKHINVE